MSAKSGLMLRWGLLPLALVLVLLSMGGVLFYTLEPTVLTMAVAPRDGTEPELLSAFASALQAHHKDIRLKITLLDDVRQSADLLDAGKVDLAVVRPDVALPTDGLTVAVLRDQVMMIASPEKRGITSFAKLAGQRLGIVSHQEPDAALLRAVLANYHLVLRTGTPPPKPARDEVWLVPLSETEVTEAVKIRRADAVLSVIAPTAPRAIDVIARVAEASPSHKLDFVSVDDEDGLLQRFPLLHESTVPAGLFGGRPAVPSEDIKTIGTSYRLMARAGLNRTGVSSLTQDLFEMRSALAHVTPAAYYLEAPSYETTVAATSALLPNHPGAIDYYERDQHGFLDRYSDLVYLLALVGSGVLSVIAWARQRLAQLRKEPLEDIADRLLEIVDEAARAPDTAALAVLHDETETLAVEAARWARTHEPSPRITTALSLALETARTSLARRERQRLAGGTAPDQPIGDGPSPPRLISSRG